MVVIPEIFLSAPIEPYSGDTSYKWLRTNGLLYTIGTILECIRDGARQGQIGHRMEIASIRECGLPTGHRFWCHGLTKLNDYSLQDCIQLRREYSHGNFGVDVDTVGKYYKILSREWDN